MNWSKCKTIFIIFFLIIDLVLLSTVFYINFNDCYVSRSQIREVEQYVSKQQLSIQAELPRWIPHMKNVELINVLRADSPLVTQFLPQQETTEETKKQLLTGDKAYESGEKKLVMDHNEFTYTDQKAFSQKTITEKSAVKFVKKELKKLGFNLQNTQISTPKETNDAFTFSFHKKLAGKELLQANLTITVQKNGALSVQGMWFNPSSHERYRKMAPRSVPDILISFSQDMHRQDKQNVTITSVELCYSIDSTETYHRTFTAAGCWKITTKDGQTYYYDIRE